MTYQEGTNDIPKPVEVALVKAREWHDDRVALERAIAKHGGIAQRNQDDLDSSDRSGAALLIDIVEAVNSTWGFA